MLRGAKPLHTPYAPRKIVISILTNWDIRAVKFELVKYKQNSHYNHKTNMCKYTIFIVFLWLSLMRNAKGLNVVTSPKLMAPDPRICEVQDVLGSC